MDLDIYINTYGHLNIFGLDIWLTDTIVNTWIIMAVLIVFCIIARYIFFSWAKDEPTGFQNVIEALVEMMNNFVITTTGEKYKWLGNWYFGAIVFIGVSNISGLFNLRPPTADASTTLALSVVTFVLITFLGIKSGPKAYFKGLMEPIFLFAPMNIIGELSTPISLGFRLFGNILAGVVITSLIYGLLPWWLQLIWPAALHFYFDIFAGLLQAFIFTILSLSFIINKVSDADV